VGNVVRDNGVGLQLANELATEAGADVSFNDFIANVEPVHTRQLLCSDTGCEDVAYILATDLSLNHWGLTCEEGGAPVLPEYVTAGQVYAAPVAAAYRTSVAGGGTPAPEALGARCP
jgi:hypothetical protein